MIMNISEYEEQRVSTMLEDIGDDFATECQFECVDEDDGRAQGNE